MTWHSPQTRGILSQYHMDTDTLLGLLLSLNSRWYYRINWLIAWSNPKMNALLRTLDKLLRLAAAPCYTAWSMTEHLLYDCDYLSVFFYSLVSAEMFATVSPFMIWNSWQPRLAPPDPLGHIQTHLCSFATAVWLIYSIKLVSKGIDFMYVMLTY